MLKSHAKILCVWYVFRMEILSSNFKVFTLTSRFAASFFHSLLRFVPSPMVRTGKSLDESNSQLGYKTISLMKRSKSDSFFFFGWISLYHWYTYVYLALVHGGRISCLQPSEPVWYDWRGATRRAPASVQRFALLADVRGNKACSNVYQNWDIYTVKHQWKMFWCYLYGRILPSRKGRSALEISPFIKSTME